MIKYISLLLLASNAQAYYYFPYSFSELETELSNLSGGVITAKADLPADARKTDFQKVGVTFYTWHNTSQIDPQDYFSINISKFNELMNAPDFLTAKRTFYSRLHFNKRTQRYYRPYGYLESWRSLSHPQIKTLDVAPTVIDQKMTPMKDGERSAANSPYFNPGLQREVDSMSGSELTIGNDLELRVNNDSFEHKIDLIRRSKKSFLGIVMVLACDRNGSRFVDELIKAKERGVDVKMMHEGVWSNITNGACVARMRKAGIDVLLPSDMFSNHFAIGVVHNKFYIRDEEEAVIGGQNLVDAETESDGFNAKMHDTDVWIHSGPEVTTLQWQFANLWHRYAKADQRERIVQYLANAESRKQKERAAHARGSEFYAEKLGNPETRMKGACRALVQGPHLRNLSIAQVLRRYTEEAQQSVIITSPEIDFDLEPKKKSNQRTELFHATIDAAKRGVDMQLILNGVDGGNGELDAFLHEQYEKAYYKDHELVRQFFQYELNHEPQKNARGHREYLLELQKVPGYHTWTHFNYMHAKQAYFDRIATMISSFNLDKASAERNYEAGAMCLDEELSTAMENQLTLDLVNSTPVVSSNENQAPTVETAQSSPDQE